jgi:hypothetical protein
MSHNQTVGSGDDKMQPAIFETRSWLISVTDRTPGRDLDQMPALIQNPQAARVGLVKSAARLSLDSLFELLEEPFIWNASSAM